MASDRLPRSSGHLSAEERRDAVYSAFFHGDVPDGGLDLGARLRYAKVDDIYHQEFERGVAFANATFDWRRVQLAEPMHTVEGSICTSLTLAPQSGDILLWRSAPGTLYGERVRHRRRDEVGGPRPEH